MSFLAFAFMCTALVDLIGYMPQIKKVLDPNYSLDSLSFKTFATWSGTLFIATLYAIFEVNDLLLSIVTGLDFAACFFIASAIFIRRRAAL